MNAKKQQVNLAAPHIFAQLVLSCALRHHCTRQSYCHCHLAPDSWEMGHAAAKGSRKMFLID